MCANWFADCRLVLTLLLILLDTKPQQRTAGAELDQVIGRQFADPHAPSFYHRSVGRAEITQQVLIAAPHDFGMMRRDADRAFSQTEHVVGRSPDGNSAALEFRAFSFLRSYEVGKSSAHCLEVFLRRLSPGERRHP